MPSTCQSWLLDLSYGSSSRWKRKPHCFLPGRGMVPISIHPELLHCPSSSAPLSPLHPHTHCTGDQGRCHLERKTWTVCASWSYLWVDFISFPIYSRCALVEGPPCRVGSLPCLCQAHTLQGGLWDTSTSPKQPPETQADPRDQGPVRAQSLQSSYCRFEDTRVCLFVAGQQRGWKKCQCRIVTYESPLSTGRDAPVLPPRVWGDRKRA